MAQTREARLNAVIERMDKGTYFIYAPDTGQQECAPDTPEWFAWLTGHRAFHFKGILGHCTVRCEQKHKRDEGKPSLWYWYAYRKVYGRQHKRYLGATEAVTVAKLEDVAGELHIAAVGSLPDDQVLTSHVQRLQPAPDGLKLGAVTFLWHEELLQVKTPTGTEYLTRTQTAELLGYLYDQREAILNKRK
jgi:hypothetical protein